MPKNAWVYVCTLLNEAHLKNIEMLLFEYEFRFAQKELDYTGQKCWMPQGSARIIYHVQNK